MHFDLIAVGAVRGGRDQPTDDHWGNSRARLEIDTSRFQCDALQGLAAFSHLEVIYLFDQVDEAAITWGARRPRDRIDWPQVGIFAQRAKGRPNRLGVSVCKLIRVEGMVVDVEGLDAIDGTPILDIKPVFSGFLPRGTVLEPEWATEVMKNYW